MARTPDFQTIRSEGGLLPTDLLQRLIDPADHLPGKQPEDYHLDKGERLTEVITLSWHRLRRRWHEFRELRTQMPEGEAGTGLTNDKWSLPVLRELGFGQLPYSPGPTVENRSYAINRFLGSAPVHLIGCGLSLDRLSAGQKGAAKVNPHGLVQDFLNRQQGALWGVVCNGLRLRLLRDSQALSRQSYLEVDLEAMFEGEVYSDFVLFWLTLHATRLVEQEAGKPGTCWLERWTQEAQEQGTRALGDLKAGVEKALETLGQGFTSHPRNAALREALHSGELSLTDFHAQLLRVVYRLIFLFVAEDRRLEGRSLLHAVDDSEPARLARERYAAHYSTTRLRDLAGRIKGSRHGDLWRQLGLVMGALSGEEAWAGARAALALPALGSFLWSPASTPNLNPPGLGSGPSAELSNHDLLETLRNLAFTRRDRQLRPVDYRRLGAEELGGVYESLLALTPQLEGGGAGFHFKEFSGNQRKTSGSYYTPDSLVQCLLDSALDPVVAEAIQDKTGAEAEQAILALKVCDPAVGSGHFLVGAAHRLARHLARARALAQGESEPSPDLYQDALRDVVSRCLYGVDINPMAAELCRVGLWLEAMMPGKPLAFLDHHIRVGNSLLGATPELIAGGIPDGAYTAIEGDDKKACSELKRRNKAERERGLGPMFAAEDEAAQARLAQAAIELDTLPNDGLADIEAKRALLTCIEQSVDYRRKLQVADAWCAAFVIRKHYPPLAGDPRYPAKEPFGLTQHHLLELAQEHALIAGLQRELGKLTELYQFFHWHLAFPEVFGKSGFDCVLGNPPWERVNVEARQFFANVRPDIAEAITSNRRGLIAELQLSEPTLFQSYAQEQRRASAEILFYQNAGFYKHLNQARLNTYVLFVELSIHIIRNNGMIGKIVPSGIVTNEGSRYLFSFLINNSRIESIIDFENREGIFPNVHRQYKFTLITITNGFYKLSPKFAFFLHSLSEYSQHNRVWNLTSEELKLISPITSLCPTFRSSLDKELTLHIYYQIKSFIVQQIDGVDWKKSDYLIMFRSDDSSHLYKSAKQLGMPDPFSNSFPELNTPNGSYLPVWEAKMIHQFDHRYSSFSSVSDDNRRKGNAEEVQNLKKDENWIAIPRFWAPITSIQGAFNQRSWNFHWSLGYRDITNATNERTAIASVLPEGGAAQPLNLFLPESPIHAIIWISSINSFVVDYIIRQRVGGVHLNITTCRQLPIISPKMMSDKMVAFISQRVLELVYTSPALKPFAQDCGWDCAHFCWSEERRFLLRCELDAAFFHLYMPSTETGAWKPSRVAEGAVRDETDEELAELKRHFPTPRLAVDYILETFPIVKRKDEAAHGEYRTKRVILEIYDELAEAIRTGLPYQTRLDPPPADPRCCHPPREAGGSK